MLNWYIILYYHNKYVDYERFEIFSLMNENNKFYDASAKKYLNTQHNMIL